MRTDPESPETPVCREEAQLLSDEWLKVKTVPANGNLSPGIYYPTVTKRSVLVRRPLSAEYLYLLSCFRALVRLVSVCFMSEWCLVVVTGLAADRCALSILKYRRRPPERRVDAHGGGVVEHRHGQVRRTRRRAILKNGECNILKSKIAQRRLRFLQDMFTTLVDAQWRWTLLVFTLSFILSWLGFALIWWLIAFTHGDLEDDHLPPMQEESGWKPCVANIYDFTSCFLFSIETQHTIGYGARTTTEECPEAIFIMCLQSIVGVMIQAFMVGIVFAKMTRPKHRTQTLLFSKFAVVCQRDGELCLMFRVGDLRKSHIIGASVRAQLIRSRTTKEGEMLAHYQTELELNADGCDSNLFFIWPITMVHRINAESPFYAVSAADVLQERFEIVVILEGTIESTGQTTQARSSYTTSEILWGHRYVPLVTYNRERQGYEVDYSKFEETVQVDTPLCSAKELDEFYGNQADRRSIENAEPLVLRMPEKRTIEPQPAKAEEKNGDYTVTL
ncbi:ATP-sensitive inward rectifier potassium channel 12 [Eumeta japonica]|uniref:ATP-sensitive inward rectifier potassium channel 12 n=1 Tax=Eumeta variegata TaxID=151549 RepID=A0A4C1XCU0_EUMVA|nr:ATP-sensitive inward rectifier potassium channel 12 [Eumeta japonica]